MALFSAPVPSVQGRDQVQQLFQAGEKRAAAALGLVELQKTPGDLELMLFTGRALAGCGEGAQARPLLERVVAGGRKKGDWRVGWALVELAGVEYGAGDEAPARAHASTAIRQEATRNIVRAAQWFVLQTGGSEVFADWALEETGHLRFHFSPGLGAAERRSYAQAREQVLVANQVFFAAKLPKKIDFFVWPDEESGRRAGLKMVGYALPGWSVVHARVDQTPGHEITHVLHYHGFNPTLLGGFIGEGVAVLFDGQTGVDRMLIAREAVARAGLERISVGELWRDWPGAESSHAYPVAGAWVERLRLRGGDARLRQLLATPDFDAAQRLYGEELAGWCAEFEHDLIAPQI